MAERGKTAIDWEEAFTFYASLPAPDRTYQAVANQFGVSVRTVETHGRTGNWKRRLKSIAAATAEQTNVRLVSSRLAEIERIQSLISATFVSYARRLHAGEVRVSPGDLERMNRLSLQLIAELESPHEAHTSPPNEDEPPRTDEHATAVLDALIAAGALEALGLQPIPNSSDTEDL